MSHNMDRLMRFAIKYPGWQTYAREIATIRAINALENKGFLIVDRESRMFRLALSERNFDKIKLNDGDTYIEK